MMNLSVIYLSYISSHMFYRRI